MHVCSCTSVHPHVYGMCLACAQELFTTLDKDHDGVLDVGEFVAQAKSAAEAEELRANFESFDAVAGAADGKLTFRKFATGTMKTPLGGMQDATFETTVQGMIDGLRTALPATTEEEEPKDLS